jgi:hypothetical protein
MRVFELLNCLFIFILIVWMPLGVRPARRGIRVLCVLLPGTLIVHLVEEGAHWQMTPAYLAASILLVWSLAGERMSSGSVAGWARVACCCC